MRCKSKFILSQIEYLVAVFLGLYLFGPENVLYVAVGVYYECGAQYSHILAAIHALLSPCAHLLGKGVVCVGYEGEREPVFLDEALV